MQWLAQGDKCRNKKSVIPGGSRDRRTKGITGQPETGVEKMKGWGQPSAVLGSGPIARKVEKK